MNLESFKFRFCFLTEFLPVLWKTPRFGRAAMIKTHDTVQFTFVMYIRMWFFAKYYFTEE